MAKEKLEKDIKEKKDKKDGKDNDKKKGVAFVHERLTELPPPRYPLGQEPALPPWSITWTPVSICLESSVPGLSLDTLTESFNKLERPGMSMVLVHPKDLAEDEMAIDGTLLAEMLKKAKEESNASWPSSDLLDKCLKSRSVLDRDNEHRNEEVRRASAVIEAKQTSEDFKAKLTMAMEEVTVAETKLKDYRTKLLEEMWTKKAERKLASKSANKVDASEIRKIEMSKGDNKQNELKEKKMENKKEGKVGKKQDRNKLGEKREKGQKGKAGKEEPEPLLVPIVTPQEQFKLYEEEVTNRRALVKELEAKLLSSVEIEATLLSTILEPFTAGRLYCVLGIDSALPVIQLAREDKSFFRAIFNVAPRPNDSSILPVSEGPGKATDDTVSGLTSSSKLSDSKMEKRASKKEAKPAKKEPKAATVTNATPPLVTEIRALVQNGSIMDPARSVCVVDVFYGTPFPPKQTEDDGDSKKQEKVVNKQMDEAGDKKRKRDGQDENAKEGKAGKEELEEVRDKGDEQRVDKKGKKSKTDKKAVGVSDGLPYEQIGQAIALAVRRLLLQVQLYDAMGGDKVKIFKVPEAKAIQGEDLNYYNYLLDEFPQGLVTVPIIVHCLLEQVASYRWPIEDIKAIEVSNLNKQIRNGIYHEFEKLGHPKWFGLKGDLGERLPTRFEEPYSLVKMDAKVTFSSTEATDNGGLPGAKVEESMADGAMFKLKGYELPASTNGCCGVLGKKTDICGVHKSEVDRNNEPTLRKGRTTKALYNPYIEAKELEESLSVTHEFDIVTQLSMILKPADVGFTGLNDVAKLDQYLSMLRATPGRSRYKMPGTPEYSEEKMGASLTALQDLCDHYEEDQPKFQSLEDALFHCKDLGLSKGVDINTMQRYKKMTAFLGMIKEDKDVFPDLDIPMEGIPEEMPPANIIKGPYDLDDMKYWCKNCLAFFQRPDVREDKPKQPLTEKELNQLKKMFETKLVNEYEKRQLKKDQSPKHNGEESHLIHKNTFPGEIINEADIVFDQSSKKEQVKDGALAERELDPQVVKMWCEGCQSVFLPPPPASLEEIWREGERMRQEMERLRARDAQAVIDAKIKSWKKSEQRIQKSVMGRRHAEGFPDRLMGEVYARAKLNLPFEIVRYDHDEDCILACLYAANTQRNVQENIPCLMPFGDFCATYDIASGEPIKKRHEVYEMEPQYKLVLDERRYMLTEQQGLVVCGLPAKTPVQYEPRATIYKDGNIIMLRATKQEEKMENVQEVDKTEMGIELGKEEEQGKKLGRMPNDTLGTKQAVSRKNREEEGDIPTMLGKKDEKESIPKKEAKRKEKTKGKEEADILDHTLGVVHVPENGDHASVPPNLTGSDSLSPTLFEYDKSVIACFKDGLIATFFFAKDATLSLQINIPGGGKTFEMTSNGVVRFLPSNTQKKEPEPSMGISTPSTSPQVESIQESKNEEKNRPNRELSPPKEKSIRDQSKKKKREDEASTFGETKVNSKKRDEKVILHRPKKGEKGGMSDKSVDPEKGEDVGQPLNALELINNLYKKNVGDIELSRCILPSGSIISYKENGSSQILFNNGNTSEHMIISGETVGWVTTNNKGFCVLQDPPTKEPAKDDEVTILEDTKVRSKSGKGKNKGVDKEKSKAAKLPEQDAEFEADLKAKEPRPGQDTKQNDAKKNKKIVSFTEQDDLGASMVRLVGSDPNLPPVAAERCHLQLPNKKVVEVFDPDSGSSIITREDLVVVMNTNDNTVRVVHHADGTHIYSEVKETIEKCNASMGQIMFDMTKEFNSSSKTKFGNLSVETIGSLPFPTIKSNMDTPPNNTKIGGAFVIAGNESHSAPELNQQTDSGVGLATQVFHAKKKLYSTQWHVRKEGFPFVHGNTNGGVAIEFTTTDGQYCVTWSRESGNISVLMPSGSMIYSNGKLVNLDASNGTKRLDPKQSLQNQLVEGPHFLNTNGIYEFNLERANLTFTDNYGNGFRSTWGYKVEVITNGLLQRPPKVVEKLEPLAKVLELTKIRENFVPTNGKKMTSVKATATLINSEVPTINNNKEPSSNGIGGSKTLQVQPIQYIEFGHSLSPISESPTMLGSNLSLTTTDLGLVSESSIVGQKSYGSGNLEIDDVEEPILGPTTRLFVIHEGGFGLEIIHENEFNKYTSSKQWSKDCTHVREVYEEANALLHTFVTVKQKAKKLADVIVQAQEGCRAPNNLKLWTRKVSEFARQIKLRAIQTKMHKKTKCDWLQVNLNLPCLPRVVAPQVLPVLPLSNVTEVVFRQIFEYPSFHDEKIPIMDRILESYNTWQENAMILTNVEQQPDSRTNEEIKQAQDVAQTIREVRAEKKLQEARDRAIVEVRHATNIFREMRNAETERLQKFAGNKDELRKKGERNCLQYKDSKKGPLLCTHKPWDNLQNRGPYRPNAHQRLCYFECEEGIKYIINLQNQQWQQCPQDPRRWSVEALPPFSYSYQGSSASQSSGEHLDDAASGYEVPCVTPRLKEEMVPKEPPCQLSEWMRELEMKTGQDEDDNEGNMCWEFIKPKRKELGPADWTPCFFVGLDEKCEEPQAPTTLNLDDIKEAYLDPAVEEVIEEPHVNAEEIGAKLPLPKLQPLWSVPTGVEWEINYEAVQRQSELIPNFPGWSKASWRKNKKYLDVNLETLPCVNISSIGTLQKRPWPPKDWSHQFLVVPDFVDFGAVAYGTISMKNYHGTKPGRFRFKNLGPSVKFLCELGMVPPGLSRAVRIFFRASALGHFSHKIKILSEYDVFEVPIFAKVVCPKGY